MHYSEAEPCVAILVSSRHHWQLLECGCQSHSSVLEIDMVLGLRQLAQLEPPENTSSAVPAAGNEALDEAEVLNQMLQKH